MNDWPTFFTANAFWTLGSVAFGFALSEFARRLQDRRQRHARRRAIEEELRQIKPYLSAKMSQVRQLMAALESGGKLPFHTVEIPDDAYRSSSSMGHAGLSSSERSALHLIHQRLKMHDNFLGATLAELREALLQDETAVLQRLRDAYIEGLPNVLRSYSLAERAIDCYLRGHAAKVPQLVEE